MIPERDVYRLITRSKLPAAEAFEEWVIGTVLPAIRNTGVYVAPGTSMEAIRAALALIQEQIASAGQAVVPFSFEGKQVRTVTSDGEPWFVLADVCRVLEYSNPSQAASRLDVDERGIITGDTPSGQQAMVIISESGLYSLILTCSRSPTSRVVLANREISCSD